MKTYNEMREAAIQQIAFQYADRFGVRHMDGEKAWDGFVVAYRRLFGDEEWFAMCHEAEKRMADMK